MVLVKHGTIVFAYCIGKSLLYIGHFDILWPHWIQVIFRTAFLCGFNFNNNWDIHTKYSKILLNKIQAEQSKCSLFLLSSVENPSIHFLFLWLLAKINPHKSFFSSDTWQVVCTFLGGKQDISLNFIFHLSKKWYCLPSAVSLLCQHWRWNVGT